MAIMNIDEEGLLEEPCLSCDKAYVEDIWNEWCCDEKECIHKTESEGQGMTREEVENLLDEYLDKHETMMKYIWRDDCIVWTSAAEYNAISEYTLLREKLIGLICEAESEDKRMKAPRLLKLDDAVKIAVNRFDADPLLAEQEFEQKTYFPAEDVYGAGFYEGFHYAINILLKEAEK